MLTEQVDASAGCRSRCAELEVTRWPVEHNRVHKGTVITTLHRRIPVKGKSKYFAEHKCPIIAQLLHINPTLQTRCVPIKKRFKIYVISLLTFIIHF